MDIVGPLPKTRKGHEYVLVVNDYATRYPEAIPIRCFTTVTVAEELMQLFARYGVPEEILTDQGTNFNAATEGALPSDGGQTNPDNTIPSPNRWTGGAV